MTTDSVVGYAFMLGMIGLLNPCGFPLLAIYLTAFVGDRDRDRIARTLSGIRAGAAIATGFLVVFVGAALLAGSVHAVLLRIAPWTMVGAGVLIVAVGVLGALGKALPLHLAPRFRTGRGFIAMAGFGVAYAVGSLSCSLPVFIAAIGGAVASGSALGVAAVVVAYGLGMGLFATALAVAVSLADATAFRFPRRMMAVIPRAAGVLCILVGLYLIGYWTAQLGGPAVVAPVTVAVDETQGALASMIENAWLPVGAVLLLAVLGALVISARHRRQQRTAPDDRRRREESL